jgi:hypothetical protein
MPVSRLPKTDCIQIPLTEVFYQTEWLNEEDIFIQCSSMNHFVSQGWQFYKLLLKLAMVDKRSLAVRVGRMRRTGGLLSLCV